MSLAIPAYITILKFERYRKDSRMHNYTNIGTTQRR